MAHFIAIDYKLCTGCKTCEAVCSLYHFGESNPSKSAIRVIRREKDGLPLSIPLVCQQCDAPKCIEVCPTQAITRDDNKKGVIFNREECIDCELCIEACPAHLVPVNFDQKVTTWCDLCDGQPQCVPACHGKCLTVVERGQAHEKQNVEYLADVLEKEKLWEYVNGRRK